MKGRLLLKMLDYMRRMVVSALSHLSLVKPSIPSDPTEKPQVLDSEPVTSPRFDLAHLDRYRKDAEQLLRNRSSEIISNGFPEHAAILIACLLRNATSCIRILCKNLQRSVFDDPEVLSALEVAAMRKLPVDIIVQKEPEEGSVFASTIQRLTDNSSIRVIPNAGAMIAAVGTLPNFAVMDDHAFRYEADPGDCKASACMELPSFAGKLIQSFDTVFAALEQKKSHA